MEFEYKQLKVNHHTYDQAVIHLPNNEMDILLVFPNGKEMEIQFRLGGPTIDICLPVPVSVTNWIGDDMYPAPPIKNHPSHVRLASQICIGLDPMWLESPENETKCCSKN